MLYIKIYIYIYIYIYNYLIFLFLYILYNFYISINKDTAINILTFSLLEISQNDISCNNSKKLLISVKENEFIKKYVYKVIRKVQIIIIIILLLLNLDTFIL